MTKRDHSDWEVLLNLDSVPMDRFVALKKAVLECPATVGALAAKSEASEALAKRQPSYLRGRIEAFVHWHLYHGSADEYRRAALQNIARSITQTFILDTCIDGLKNTRVKASAHIRARRN